MAAKQLCMVLVVLLSAFIYSLNKNLGITTALVLKNDSECVLHPLPMPTEDIAIYKNFFIGATVDFPDVTFKHRSAHTMKPGYLISIDRKSMKVSKINTKGFPQEFQLNSHGIKVFNDKTLYVLSHSYKKGGERIFVFDLEIVEGEVEATYRDSYHFPGDDGIYNSIAFVDEKHFFITQWVPHPDSPEGRENDSKIAGLFHILSSLYIKSTALRLCTITEKNTVTCEIKDYGYMFNGIHYEDGTLFVADTFGKTIKVFKVAKNFELEFVQSFATTVSPDNIWFHNGVGYFAGLAKVVQFLQLSDAVKRGEPQPVLVGGTERFSLKDGTWVSEVMVIQDKLSLPTASIVTDKIYLVSILQPGILECPIAR